MLPAIYSMLSRQELLLKYSGLPSYEAYITGAMVLYGLLEAQIAESSES